MRRKSSFLFNTTHNENKLIIKKSMEKRKKASFSSNKMVKKTRLVIKNEELIPNKEKM